MSFKASKMVASDKVSPSVLLKAPHHHQNPIKFLELFVKGFCPIIQDRVDVNDHADCSREACAVKGQGAEILDQTTTRSVATPETSLAKRSPLKAKKDSVEEEPFEIAERPPSTLIGISKKIWENVCSNPVISNPSKACQGFCSNRRVIRSDDEIPPHGEECSVGTATSSTIDLSPHSSPRSARQRQIHDGSFLVEAEEEEDDDDDECLPIAEYKNERSYRGTHVLVVTLLALYITIALLKTIAPVRFNFSLEGKADHTPRPLVFAITYR